MEWSPYIRVTGDQRSYHAMPEESRQGGAWSMVAHYGDSLKVFESCDTITGSAVCGISPTGFVLESSQLTWGCVYSNRSLSQGCALPLTPIKFSVWQRSTSGWSMLLLGELDRKRIDAGAGFVGHSELAILKSIVGEGRCHAG